MKKELIYQLIGAAALIAITVEVILYHAFYLA